MSDARAGRYGIVESPWIHRDDARATIEQDLRPAPWRRAEVQCPFASEVFYPGEV